MRYRYSGEELEILLKNICIVIDTQEKEFKHISDFFDKKKIKYKKQKLETADYSAYIESNEETIPIGITKDLYFHDLILIERKASLEEISGNLTNKKGTMSRQRLEREFFRAQKIGAKIVLIIENGNGLEDIIKGNYNTEYNNVSFYASLKAFEARFNLSVKFLDKSLSGMEIYNTIKYYIREELRK